jgi:phosphoserine phosphatase
MLTLPSIYRSIWLLGGTAIAFFLLLGTFSTTVTHSIAADSAILPSWNEGRAKTAIIEFVNRVTESGSPDYVQPAERIAVFDNDGTLWSEKPFYFQLFFAIDRIKSMAPANPSWSTEMPYKTILENDTKAIGKFTEQDIVQLVAATHSDITVEAFQAIAIDWLKTAKHPRFNRLFTDCVFQPMLELLDYLRAKDFKIFIVSGGGTEFVRAFSEKVYGIPPENVIGSSVKTRFEQQNGQAVLMKLPEIESYNDKAVKPANINLHIGRKPILAFGNSDGDLAMLQYTADNQRPSLMLLLHHDDEEREWAYDRQSRIGRLDKAWDEAKQRGWTIVSMRDDFKQVYPSKK